MIVLVLSGEVVYSRETLTLPRVEMLIECGVNW